MFAHFWNFATFIQNLAAMRADGKNKNKNSRFESYVSLIGTVKGDVFWMKLPDDYQMNANATVAWDRIILLAI
jgi:hypothetical protein